MDPADDAGSQEIDALAPWPLFCTTLRRALLNVKLRSPCTSGGGRCGTSSARHAATRSRGVTERQARVAARPQRSRPGTTMSTIVATKTRVRATVRRADGEACVVGAGACRGTVSDGARREMRRVRTGAHDRAPDGHVRDAAQRRARSPSAPCTRRSPTSAATRPPRPAPIRLVVARRHDEAGDESDPPEGHEHAKDGIFQGSGTL